MNDFNDIGISRTLDWQRIRKLLAIGVFASVLHLGGDMIPALAFMAKRTAIARVFSDI